MTITYSMKIDSLDCVPSLDGLSNVVTRAIWTMTGTDGALSDFTSASTEFPLPSAEHPFVSFDELTEATVISWVEEHTDAGYLESRRSVIAELIAQQAAPIVITPALPWIAPEEDPE